MKKQKLIIWRKNMSKHPSLKGASTIRQSRNVLKRFERINLLKADGRWKEGQKVLSALPKTKPLD
jgi:small basic protein (TIGR04137 family)